MARPLKKIPIQAIEIMAVNGFNDEQIAEACGCDARLIRRRFGSTLREKRQEMRQKLRAKQIEEAMKGNTAMLIWLGKQYLDQSDKTENLLTSIPAIRPIGFNFPAQQQQQPSLKQVESESKIVDATDGVKSDG